MFFSQLATKQDILMQLENYRRMIDAIKTTIVPENETDRLQVQELEHTLGDIWTQTEQFTQL
nr:hypothetical protein [Microctonus hyperodae filamentous virus]